MATKDNQQTLYVDLVSNSSYALRANQNYTFTTPASSIRPQPAAEPAKNSWCATVDIWSGTLRDEPSRVTIPYSQNSCIKLRKQNKFTN
jgi:hypothetical protein